MVAEFPVEYAKICERMEAIDVKKYCKSRNFIWGAVTYLSPYISRGVISVRDVRDFCIGKFGYEESDERFYQELAWREYWQQTWMDLGDGIFSDIRRNQSRFYIGNLGKLPSVVLNAETGVKAIDTALNDLRSSGYIHNHLRMYIASIVCNLGGYEWKLAADWMYYHLLDGDLASNHLSWQWVAGTNSSKLYYCNQENINKYMNTSDSGTFLDFGYDALMNPNRIFKELEAGETFKFEKPESLLRQYFVSDLKELGIERGSRILLYHYYHLDPRWRIEEDEMRVFFYDDAYFDVHPIGENALRFAIDLAMQIPGMRFFRGSIKDLDSWDLKLITREHPMVNGIDFVEYDERKWMAPKMKRESSFFGFWKKAKKYVTQCG